VHIIFLFQRTMKPEELKTKSWKLEASGQKLLLTP
jgi:hypothetical protein